MTSSAQAASRHSPEPASVPELDLSSIDLGGLTNAKPKNPAQKAIAGSSASSGSPSALKGRELSAGSSSASIDEKAGEAVAARLPKAGAKVEMPSSTYARQAYDACLIAERHEDRKELKEALIGYHKAFHLQQKAEKNKEPKFQTAEGRVVDKAYFSEQIRALCQSYPYLRAVKIPAFKD